MAYPATPKFGYPYQLSAKYRVSISDFDSGAEQRRQLVRFPKRSIPPLVYRVLSKSDRDTLADFHTANSGPYGTFYFFDPAFRHWSDEYLGKSNGSTQTFDLHSKLTSTDSTLKIMANGSTAGITWGYSSGSGTDGADQIFFTVSATSGALYTSNFNGYLRIKARYKNEFAFQEEMVLPNKFNVQVELEEVQW